MIFFKDLSNKMLLVFFKASFDLLHVNVSNVDVLAQVKAMISTTDFQDTQKY